MRGIVNKRFRDIEDASVVHINVPLCEEDKCDPFFFGRRMCVIPVFYIQQCKAYIIRELESGVYGIVPEYLVKVARENPPIFKNVDDRSQKIVFTIGEDTKTDTGNDISNTQCDGYIIHEFENGQVLIRLPDYEESCYFSGYDIPVLVKKIHFNKAD